MKRFALLVVLWLFSTCAVASANVDAGGSLGGGGAVDVHIGVSAPGSGTPGHTGDDSARPLLNYTVTWSVDPTPAQTGSLDGLCVAAGGTTQQPNLGFLYHLVGRDATGAIVDDRFVCIAFPDGDTTQRPPVPAVPAVPTFGEVWESAHLPPPAITLDPATRGITGLDTRISTDGPTTVVIDATIRGYTMTGVATLDHYTISVDGQPVADAGSGHYTFETKGNHTVAVGAVWHAAGTLTMPDPPGGSASSDWGTATITSTRAYPVNEIRSVLQP